MESLVHVIWITGAASLVFAWSRMGLFGGPSQEELDSVTAERDELKKKLDRVDIRVDEQKKKVGKLQSELEEAGREIKEVRRRATEHRDECRKLQRQLEAVESGIVRAPAEQQRREELLVGLREEVQGLKARGAQLSADLEEARQQVGSLERDKARLEKSAEAAKEEAAAVPDAVGGPSGPKGIGAAPPPTNEEARPAVDEGFRAKLRDLKEAVRIKEGLLRKVRRQAEHNRRAYMITQLQLELAHDEVYELKHGKPRRDTERSRQQRPRAVVEPEAFPMEEEVGAGAPPTVEVGAGAPLIEDIEPAPPPESPPEDTE